MGSRSRGQDVRVGLVGCVKTKRSAGSLARDLYISTLFTGRRRYVETSCDCWFVLSARHGLVRDDDWLEPYDETLNDQAVPTRRTPEGCCVLRRALLGRATG